ncbi:hypothetical protein PoB_001966900 [Plakobranchus ocellatus]|uniref:Uncharacterized protein n=1 Tax=Plakobranchus ocellatus TaxID=259542 RepID=A0AAV3ZCR1_9GAST|nr:hypothetical protein PoB_001966900 [Plakobranchus ocellatus]
MAIFLSVYIVAIWMILLIPREDDEGTKAESVGAHSNLPDSPPDNPPDKASGYFDDVLDSGYGPKIVDKFTPQQLQKLVIEDHPQFDPNIYGW